MAPTGSALTDCQKEQTEGATWGIQGVLQRQRKKMPLDVPQERDFITVTGSREQQGKWNTWGAHEHQEAGWCRGAGG